MANVVLEHVKKVYPVSASEQKRLSGTTPHAAVEDFSLEIKDKEFVVLVGPSGCGKSTTLRMIAGLEEITDGNIYIGGKLVNDVVPKDRDIAMVFQNYALYPHMTVYENMAFSLQLKKVDKKIIDQKVREAAEILGITEYLDRKPKALSGGQRQRVAIGRAIVREPQVFLMDEPLSNLDAKLRNQMRAEIIKLRSRIDTTFVYVTHDQTEAMTLGDRIVIMKDGLIMQVGTPQEVFDRPADLFVAGFIGLPQMNFFDAELHHTEAFGYFLTVAGEEIHLNDKMQQELSARNIERGPVTLGVRPDHIRLSVKNGIPCTLDVTEMMGSALHLHVKVGDQEAVVVVPTMGLSPEQQALFRPGVSLLMDLNSSVLHLFDKETGKNLLV